MTDFFAMGGYAWYVWGSYGVTVLVLVAEIVALRRRAREAKA
jgi:heme exporter protein D